MHVSKIECKHTADALRCCAAPEPLLVLTPPLAHVQWLVCHACCCCESVLAGAAVLPGTVLLLPFVS